MRKPSWQVCLAGICFALIMTSGNAAIIVSFDTVPEGTAMPNGGTYYENGMQATSHSDYSVLQDSLSMLPTNALYFHGNDGAGANTAGVIGPNNAYIEFREIDGSHFDLLSLDLVSGGNFGTPSRRWITTSAGGAPFWPQFGDSARVVPLTFSGAAYSDLDWFRVGTVWFATELDNIAFNVVPEPGTAALLAMGALGFLGAARRRRGK